MPTGPDDKNHPANNNVVDLPIAFRGNLPVKYIIENTMARERQLEDCVIIGRFKDTGHLYLTTTTDDAALLNWLIDRIKYSLLSGNLPEIPYEPSA